VAQGKLEREEMEMWAVEQEEARLEVREQQHRGERSVSQSAAQPPP